MTERLPGDMLVAWYGDDFTGSAAVMEVLEFAGIPAVLFLDVPSPGRLAHFPDATAIGIASTARTRSPDWMEEHLPPAFAFMRDTGAPIVHYKVCSTLDSAGETGSIGKAIDIGAPIIGGKWVPCLVAAPALRRYQAFGHLFASAPGGVFRLDRHPVMARHPVTPMDESDVALHLSKQTDRPFGLVNIEDLGTDPQAGLAREIGRGADVICLDSVTAPQLAAAGALMWENRGDRLFAVGSQGVEYALVSYWRAAGMIAQDYHSAGAGPVDRMLAVSGSVSSVTAAQIDWAEANGFTAIAYDAALAATGDKAAENAAYETALAVLDSGRDPLIFTARGPDDPAVARMQQTVAAAAIAPDQANARIGGALGRLLARLLRQTGIRRAAISGGDTSGYAVRELDIFAFTARAATIPGAPLLEAHSDNPALDGLQLALKGGQMGSADYFGWIKRGGGAVT